MPNVKRDPLQRKILSQVKYGSKVYTDQAVAYDKLTQNYMHEVVNHLEGYVNGRPILLTGLGGRLLLTLA